MSGTQDKQQQNQVQNQYGTQTQNQNFSQGPWAPAQNQLLSILGLSQNAYNQAQSNNAATQPSGFVAGLNPQQIATFNQMVNYGGTNQNPAIASNTGANLTGTGASGLGTALAGLQGYNPLASNNTGALINAANQYAQGYNIPAEVQNAMQQATETARDVTLPGIDQAAASSGNANSSRAGIAQGLVERGLAEQAGNLAGTLQNQAYGTGLNLASNTAQANNAAQLAALQGAGSLAGNTANLGLGALSQGVADQGNLFNIAGAGGSGLQQGQQDIYSNQLAANQFGVQSPWAALSPYLQSIGGIAGMGTQGASSGSGTYNQIGNTDTTLTKTPSALSVIGGLLGAGGSLLGSKPGMYGGGSGLLGAGLFS